MPMQYLVKDRLVDECDQSDPEQDAGPEGAAGEVGSRPVVDSAFGNRSARRRHLISFRLADRPDKRTRA